MSLFVTGNRGALALIGGFTGDLSLAPTETFDTQDGTLSLGIFQSAPAYFSRT